MRMLLIPRRTYFSDRKVLTAYHNLTHVESQAAPVVMLLAIKLATIAISAAFVNTVFGQGGVSDLPACAVSRYRQSQQFPFGALT